MAKRNPLAIRFWQFVSPIDADSCWEWRGSIARSGYGQIHVGPGPGLAHRVSWNLAHGEIPDGLFVLHHCDNRPCVNPSHLFLGTQADNVRDCKEKGRLVLPSRSGPWRSTAAWLASPESWFTCEGCGCTFQLPHPASRRQRFCNRACYDRTRRENRVLRPPSTRGTGPCRVCGGNDWFYRPRRPESRECRACNRRITREGRERAKADELMLLCGYYEEPVDGGQEPEFVIVDSYDEIAALPFTGDIEAL